MEDGVSYKIGSTKVVAMECGSSGQGDAELTEEGSELEDLCSDILEGFILYFGTGLSNSWLFLRVPRD